MAAYTAAYLQFSAFRANWEKEIERHLTAVATFKAFQVEQWYKENLDHSRFFTANATLARVADEYFAASSPNTRDELFSQFTAIKQNLGYDAVRLFDAAGASLLSVGARPDQVCSPVQKGVAKALQTKEPVTSDIYRNEHTGCLEFSIFAPLIEAGPAANVTGVLVLSFDPGPLFALRSIREKSPWYNPGVRFYLASFSCECEK